jgi:peptidoglycan hydrolase-like protein with peptidoglycan-binding domain
MSGATEPTLRLGDQSADGWVEYLQEFACLLGLPVNLTGKSTTPQAVVIRFQQSKGLLVDGVVGNQTWAALRVENPRPIGTDGLAPHTFEQHGSQARWFTEPFMQAQYDALHDSLLLPAVNTGDVEFVEGSFPATANP